MKKHLGLITLGILLTAKLAVLLLFIQGGTISLGPDEAQYWTWSQALDIGYYSKPPAIAWQMAAGTYFLGLSELGIRVGALILSTLTALAVYLCGRCAGIGDRVSAWAGAALAFSPMGVMGALLATTDGGLTLFWTLSMAVLVLAIQKEKAPNWFLFGFLIMVAALFKWAAYLLWAPAIVGLLFYQKWRSKKIFFALPISLLGLLPSLIWNAGHDFASFRHVWGTNVSPHGSGNVLEFIGAQAALISPVLFVLLVVSIFHLRKAPKGVAFLGWCWVAIVGLYTAMAFGKKIQGNWCIFVYPAACLPMVWMASKKCQRWLKVGLGLSVVSVVLVLAIPSFQAKLPYKVNPFRHAVGWNNLPSALREAGYAPEKSFLFSDKYQTASLLSFYSPQKKRAYFFNISKSRKNQFSYWPSMAEEQEGKEGFFVWAENLDRIKDKKGCLDHYLAALNPYFEEVEFVGEYPLLEALGKPVKSAFVFRCHIYNGLEPEKIETY